MKSANSELERDIMPLTVDDVLEAVNAVPGITKEAITKTLLIGGLTTAIAQVEDQIALALQARQDAHATTEAEISALNQQKEALLAQRKALLQGQ
jgi:type IV secretory pathway protease TraF